MTEPSKGAMRAARALAPRGAKAADAGVPGAIAALEQDATIIDRETKAGLMLEALRAIGPYLTDCRHDVRDGPQLVRRCPKCNALRKRAAAINAAENGDS